MPEPAGVLGSLPAEGGPGIPVPERGAWLRRGISRNGGPLVEDREVVWLQAGPYFADSRGFAGVTSFDGSRVHFHHLRGEPGEDTGTFRWEGANLVEWGSNTDAAIRGRAGGAALRTRVAVAAAPGEPIAVSFEVPVTSGTHPLRYYVRSNSDRVEI
ncbi:hypothetical protein AB0I68_37970 [Streptomyces sp. NPDC050448]|uniref:hypothetical protein n=1 Tax=Streptomyces sp. NPDC050448 TaxID=3155404 RepID=UPI00343F2E63